MHGRERFVANEASVLAPGFVCQSVAHGVEHGAIAFDPAVADDLAFELARLTRTVFVHVTLRLLNLAPLLLGVFVVGDEQNERRIGIPILELLEEEIVGPDLADLAPRLDRAERTHLWF